MENIIEIFENEKPYLLERYKLADLSLRVGILPQILSSIINSKFKMSFPDLINQYRINYAVKLLEKSVMKKISIEGIAYESGFSNKVSFYNAFKKFKHCLPVEYLNTLKSNKDEYVL